MSVSHRSRRTLLVVALLACAVALTAGGCGSNGDKGGGTKSVTKAKTDLVTSCHRGHSGDNADLKLCRCIADSLVSKDGYDVKQLDAAVKTIEAGHSPPKEVPPAGKRCKAQVATSTPATTAPPGTAASTVQAAFQVASALRRQETGLPTASATFASLQAGARRDRDVVFKYDAVIRKIRFPDSVRPAVNRLLTANGTLIAALDDLGQAGSAQTFQTLFQPYLRAVAARVNAAQALAEAIGLPRKAA